MWWLSLTPGSSPTPRSPPPRARTARHRAGPTGGWEVLGDSADGTGDALAAPRNAGHTPIIKPWPPRPAVEGGFTLDHFTVIEPRGDQLGAVTCPNGVTRPINPTRNVVVGESFRFGRGGAGDVGTFRRLVSATGLDSVEVGVTTVSGKPVSAIWIRAPQPGRPHIGAVAGLRFASRRGLAGDGLLRRVPSQPTARSFTRPAHGECSCGQRGAQGPGVCGWAAVSRTSRAASAVVCAAVTTPCDTNSSEITSMVRTRGRAPLSRSARTTPTASP